MTSRAKVVQDTYPGVYDLAVQTANPSHKNKYLLWIGKQLDKGHSVPDIQGTVDAFHKNCARLKNSDIYQYNDLKDLENEIKEIGLSKRSEMKSAKELAHPIYEDEVFGPSY